MSLSCDARLEEKYKGFGYYKEMNDELPKHFHSSYFENEVDESDAEREGEEHEESGGGDVITAFHREGYYKHHKSENGKKNTCSLQYRQYDVYRTWLFYFFYGGIIRFYLSHYVSPLVGVEFIFFSITQNKYFFNIALQSCKNNLQV